MPITDWPQEDQPREKMLAKGVEHLTDAELVAIIFNTGARGMNALEMAKSLLVTHGGLKNLIAMTVGSLQQKGIGHAKHIALKAAVEIGKRYLAENIQKGEKLTSSQRTQAFLAHHLRHQPNEVFACLFLDTHLRLIHYEALFEGTVNEAHVYPREIVRQALKTNAAKVILAHNHPSGTPNPSNADKDITRLIQNALLLIDVEVVDHIIVGAESCFSFAERGML